MKKLLLTLVAMVMSLASYAQWTKPATPTAMPLTVGTEVYLYNLDAEGFLCGANDWGTRASVEALHGHKIWIQKLESDDVAWDGKSYFISNFIEQGGMANQVGCMFMSDAWNFWVDRAKNAAASENQGFYFVEQGANIYKIQPSDHNQDLQAQNFPDNYIGMKPVKNDNRLYLNIPEVYGDVEADAWYTRWIFIASADYQPFVDEMIRYNAAVALGKAIEKALAENEGIDIKEVQDVYGNTASTTDELEKASARLTELVLAFQTARVSVDTPADYTPYITNPSYENNNNEGWSGDAPGFQAYGNAERYWGNLNHYQQLPELPAGVYRVQVTGFYRAGWNEVDAERYQATLGQTGESEWQKAKVYVDGSMWNHQVALPLHSTGASEEILEGSTDAPKTNVGYVPNNMETADVYVKAGQYKPTTISTILSEGQRMTIGIRKTETFDGDWMIWDDWKLYYLGASNEAYQLIAQEVLAGSTDYEQMVANDEDLYFQKSVYEAYVAAKNALVKATAADKITSAITTFQPAYDALEKSIAAYTAYYEAYNEAKDWVETMASTSDEAGLLADYVYGEEATGFNGHGGAVYILREGPLTADEVKAEKAYLEKLLADAIASGMSDGDDCTNLLKNPNFADETGWTASVGPQFHYEGLNLLLGHNMVFDVYQELTGLQNGLYEFSYSGFYRPGNPGGFDQGMADAAKCYAYINNYETRVPSILDDMSDEPIGDTYSNFTYEEGKYYPNSAATTAEYFKAGKYAAHAYGLVTDGKMRIGFKNNLRVADGSEAWFGPVRLIFRAKNAEALREVLSITLATVDGMKDNFCGMPELNTMSEAADDAVNATDEELYNALIALKKAIEDVELSTVAYQKMEVALFNLEQAIANNTAASAATIAEAQALFNKHNDAYLGQEYTTEEAEEATAEMNAMVVNILFPKDEASEENPVDYTEAIVNNNFDPARGDKNAGTIEGWTTTAMNGYKEYTVSYNRAPFELYQKLTGLPKGKYKVTVHTYYRAGYYNEEEDRVNQGVETHLTTLYAQTSEDKYTTKVKNLYEDAADTDLGVKCYTLSNGKFAPDGTSPTAAFFKAGYYLNELVFTVPEDGEVTIGLSKTEMFANDYEVVGEWNLLYMGDVKPSEENPVDYSSIIVNPTFDPARGDKNTQTIEGWTTTAMNGYKEYTVSYNRTGFELNQKLTGLPKGKYKVTVHTYYRAGYYNEEEDRVNRGEETHLTTLYAQTSEDKYTTKVMNLCEDAADTDLGVKCYTLSNGKFAPDGTTPTAAFFKAGYYLNELAFTVPEDGEVTIGLSKTESYANDYEVVGEWKLWYMGEEKNELEETDMSSLIVNNTFDPARGDKNTGTIEGWVTSAMNGYKEYTCSYNRAPIELYQDLSGLPEGTYKVTVHTYYRAGYYNEEEDRVNRGEETHLTTLYAQTSDERYAKKVMNLYEDATDEPVDGVKCYTLGNGKYAPDGTSPTAAYFKAGYYLNELPFYVSNDGSVRIGLSKTEVLANDYEVVGEWNLYYYGKGNNLELLTGIEGVVSEARTETMPVGIYSLNGTRLSTFQRGINIIRMADGTVRKILVK